MFESAIGLLFGAAYLLGVFAVARLCFEGAKMLLQLFLFVTPASLPARYGRGSYAVISDPTSTEGLAFARRLAAQHFNLIFLILQDSSATLVQENAALVAKEQPGIEVKVQKVISGASAS